MQGGKNRHLEKESEVLPSSTNEGYQIEFVVYSHVRTTNIWLHFTEHFFRIFSSQFDDVQLQLSLEWFYTRRKHSLRNVSRLLPTEVSIGKKKVPSRKVLSPSLCTGKHFPF